MSSYNISAYYAPSFLLDMIRDEIGKDTFDSVLQTFYKQYSNTHPETGDFIKTLNEVTGSDWQPFFDKHFYRAETHPDAFKGLNDTYKTGLRYSIIPDLPDSDEVVISILPLPWIMPDTFTNIRIEDTHYGTGCLFYAKHRLTAGFTAVAFPYYQFDNQLWGVYYLFNTPLYILKKPVNYQGITIQGERDWVLATLSTSLGPSLKLDLPSFTFDLSYSYINSLHLVSTKTYFNYIKSTKSNFITGLDTNWYPFLKLRYTLSLSIPIYWQLYTTIAYSTGWTDTVFQDYYFSNLIFGDNSGNQEFQKINASITIPVTGDRDWDVIFEILKFNKLSFEIGWEGYIPELIHEMNLHSHDLYYNVYGKAIFSWIFWELIPFSIEPLIYMNSMNDFKPQFSFQVNMAL